MDLVSNLMMNLMVDLLMNLFGGGSDSESGGWFDGGSGDKSGN